MRPSLVCYADILGYKSLSRRALEDGHGGEFLGHIHSALSRTHARVRERSEGWAGHRYFSVKVFTDNIVVGYPLRHIDSDFGEPEMGDMLHVFAELQTALAIEGFLVRGGISFGNHYMDDDIVYGDALIEAVELDRPGGPPRLVLGPSASRLVDRYLGFYGGVRHSPHYEDLLVDADGALFLNYLAEAFVAFPDEGVFFDVIGSHRDTIIRGLEDYRSQLDARAKYEWVARYHNFVCRDFVERHPVPSGTEWDEYAAAADEAHGLLRYLVDAESLAAHPRHIELDRA